MNDWDNIGVWVILSVWVWLGVSGRVSEWLRLSVSLTVDKYVTDLSSKSQLVRMSCIKWKCNWEWVS